MAYDNVIPRSTMFDVHMAGCFEAFRAVLSICRRNLEGA